MTLDKWLVLYCTSKQIGFLKVSSMHPELLQSEASLSACRVLWPTRRGNDWKWQGAVAVMSSHFKVEHTDLTWAALSSTCSFHPLALRWKLFAASEVVSGVPVSCVNVERNTPPPREVLKISWNIKQGGRIGWQLWNTEVSNNSSSWWGRWPFSWLEACVEIYRKCLTSGTLHCVCILKGLTLNISLKCWFYLQQCRKKKISV